MAPGAGLLALGANWNQSSIQFESDRDLATSAFLTLNKYIYLSTNIYTSYKCFIKILILLIMLCLY